MVTIVSCSHLYFFCKSSCIFHSSGFEHQWLSSGYLLPPHHLSQGGPSPSWGLVLCQICELLFLRKLFQAVAGNLEFEFLGIVLWPIIWQFSSHLASLLKNLQVLQVCAVFLFIHPSIPMLGSWGGIFVTVHAPNFSWLCRFLVIASSSPVDNYFGLFCWHEKYCEIKEMKYRCFLLLLWNRKSCCIWVCVGILQIWQQVDCS